MPITNETHPYDYPTSTASDFKRLGHPGKWKKSALVTGDAVFTGVLYGVGGILPFSGASGTAYLSDGGSIDISKLATGHIHELSVAAIDDGNNVYVLFRNQVIR